jgi:exosortase A-associated hydrolase 1
MSTEAPISFRCGDADLVGMVHRPDDAPRGARHGAPRRGVLIVVGGPQYRIGSHRQFLLLARALSENGIAAMRFDYRGLGDSGGEFAGFENIDDDLRAAVDAFQQAVPGLEEIVLWGLCDAASAILFYAPADARITASVLLNPWVRSETGYAKTQLKHYYLKRLTSREMWSKILRGRFQLTKSLGSFFGTVRTATADSKNDDSDDSNDASGNPLADRMADGLAQYDRPVMLIMSGNDLTAREFDDAVKASSRWQKLVADGRMARHDLPAADHTFSRRAWRDEVATITVDWVSGLPD